MSHIIVKQIMGREAAFAGRDWWYEFRSFPGTFDEQKIRDYVQSLSTVFSKTTKIWNDDYNSEWLARLFLSLKMILSASVMLQSLEYASRKNLRIVDTYLEYYSILMAMRSLVFVTPLVEWRDGDLIKIEHKKTINVACDVLAKIDKDLSDNIKNHVLYLKACRELISYRAPSSGDSTIERNNNISAKNICQIFVELAQIQSEILEASFHKHASGTFNFNSKYIQQVCNAEIEGSIFFDKEDAYRMDYLRRKYSIPTNICHMMSEGHVEDFFGAWCPGEEGEEDSFDPDDDWRIIFNVP